MYPNFKKLFFNGVLNYNNIGGGYESIKVLSWESIFSHFTSNALALVLDSHLNHTFSNLSNFHTPVLILSHLPHLPSSAIAFSVHRLDTEVSLISFFQEKKELAAQLESLNVYIAHACCWLYIFAL